MTTNLSAHTPTETPIPTGGETTAGPITVTILDAATIFEGPETVYRYDLPGTGIVEGWALGQVLSLIHISEPTRLRQLSRMPSSA